MTALLRRNYDVSLVAWGIWRISLNAESKEAAEAEAERIWCEEGEEAFKHKDGGIEYIDAEDCGPAEGGAA